VSVTVSYPHLVDSVASCRSLVEPIRWSVCPCARWLQTCRRCMRTASTCTPLRRPPRSSQSGHRWPVADPSRLSQCSSRNRCHGWRSCSGSAKFVRRLNGLADRRKWCRNLHSASCWSRSATGICHRPTCWMPDAFASSADGTVFQEALQTVTNMC